MDHRRRAPRVPGVCVATLVLVATACGSATEDDGFDHGGDSPAAFSTASELEGIEPIVSENSSVGIPEGHQFLFRNNSSGEVELSVTLQTEDVEPITPNGALLDGRPASIVDGSDDPERTSIVTFVREDGNKVALQSLLDRPTKLIALVDGLDFPTEQTISDIDGYTLVSAVPQPYFDDGYSTTYDLGNGARASINVHTMIVDEYPLWEFASAEEITVLDDTRAFVVRSRLIQAVDLAFRYPDTDLFVRVTITPEDTPTRDSFPLDESDLDAIVDGIEFRAPTADEIR